MREILSGHTNPRGRATDTAVTKQYPHLMFRDIEHYWAACDLALKYSGKALDSFRNCFAHLERICVNRNMTAEIAPDHVPHSFYFQIYGEDGSRDMNGGIILHGANAKTFSVELNPDASPHWSLHT